MGSITTFLCLVGVLTAQSGDKKRQTAESSSKNHLMKREVEISEPVIKNFAMEVGLNGKINVFVKTAVTERLSKK